MIELSKFYGDNDAEATVYQNANGFFATTRSKTGVYSTIRFSTEQLAEDYSDEWVNKDE